MMRRSRNASCKRISASSATDTFRLDFRCAVISENE